MYCPTWCELMPDLAVAKRKNGERNEPCWPDYKGQKDVKQIRCLVDLIVSNYYTTPYSLNLVTIHCKLKSYWTIKEFDRCWPLLIWLWLLAKSRVRLPLGPQAVSAVCMDGLEPINLPSLPASLGKYLEVLHNPYVHWKVIMLGLGYLENLWRLNWFWMILVRLHAILFFAASCHAGPDLPFNHGWIIIPNVTWMGRTAH